MMHYIQVRYFILLKLHLLTCSDCHTFFTDKSLVVCAPTGSGKTVVFEMAIVQLLMEMEEKNSTEDFKIIYSKYYE